MQSIENNVLHTSYPLNNHAQSIFCPDTRFVPFSTHHPNSILPALAFSLDMFSKTDQSYGVNEVLLASVLASVVFSLFAAQPLTIVGVTGQCENLYPFADLIE